MRMLKLLAACMLRHRGDHAQGREGAEERGLQDVRLLVGVHTEIVERVVAALQSPVRLRDHFIDSRMKRGAELSGALAVTILLRLSNGVRCQFPGLVRREFV